jgi:hypothetical protein
MKLFDYILLQEEEKKLIVLHEGVLIGKRKEGNHFVFLFQLGNFYVETFCDFHTKHITEFRMFVHTHLLEPYLDTISLEGLLSE